MRIVSIVIFLIVFLGVKSQENVIYPQESKVDFLFSENTSFEDFILSSAIDTIVFWYKEYEEFEPKVMVGLVYSEDNSTFTLSSKDFDNWHYIICQLKAKGIQEVDCLYYFYDNSEYFKYRYDKNDYKFVVSVSLLATKIPNSE